MAEFNLNDYGLSAAALELKHGDTGKGEHPEYSREAWAASSLRKRFSYWGWVEAQLDDELTSLNAEVGNLGLGIAL